MDCNNIQLGLELILKYNIEEEAGIKLEKYGSDSLNSHIQYTKFQWAVIEKR